jgi:hypothetical protein
MPAIYARRPLAIFFISQPRSHPRVTSTNSNAYPTQVMGIRLPISDTCSHEVPLFILAGKEARSRARILTEISAGEALGKQRQTRSVQPRGLRFVVIKKRGQVGVPRLVSASQIVCGEPLPSPANSARSRLLSGHPFWRASA